MKLLPFTIFAAIFLSNVIYSKDASSETKKLTTQEAREAMERQQKHGTSNKNAAEILEGIENEGRATENKNEGGVMENKNEGKHDHFRDMRTNIKK